jgi:hypothetical protein
MKNLGNRATQASELGGSRDLADLDGHLAGVRQCREAAARRRLNRLRAARQRLIREQPGR